MRSSLLPVCTVAVKSAPKPHSNLFPQHRIWFLSALHFLQSHWLSIWNRKIQAWTNTPFPLSESSACDLQKRRQTFTSPPKALQTVSVGAAVCCCLRSFYLHGNGLAWPLWGDASVTLADINWRCVCDASAHLSERGCAACVFWKWQRQRGGGGCVDFFGVH